jgi:hypothetical protein
MNQILDIRSKFYNDNGCPIIFDMVIVKRKIELIIHIKFYDKK